VAGKHNDFEEVGRTPRHHTLFEMLGNFSFGDYFKRDAIRWAWDFLTRDLGIPGERLAATVYTTDDTAFEVWRDEIGLPPERLVRWGDFPAGDEKNWWRMADMGPCGPCSEIHFDRGAQFSEGDFCIPDHSEHCPRWLEVWNLVFMEFELHADRSLTPLPAPGVDTGMGLERLASVVQQVPSNYDTDLFEPIHARMRELVGHDPDAFEAERFSYQVIADHSRAVTFLVGDGVLPANEGRGYVLRRILRRACLARSPSSCTTRSAFRST
jgi:alanyl-tRNA synthetase